ncbi:hypothetical protein RHGRI_020344 [Rhododendron griersonianum]|uniref:Ubiquitin-like domain-containing protein n=1 Tax=Rhododendron griersonianum TaxID=479676 RepID=A0AAV6JND1_9ERIC|nr:hypothetical protein RHGRI_020344 [Rhododendron griersonianum]
MVEIEDNNLSCGGEGDKKVQISIKTVGPFPPSLLNVPSPIKVQELRKLIGGNADLPIEHLSIILRGNVLHDNKNGIEEFIQLKNGGDEVSDSGWKQYFASECNQLRKRLMEMNKFGSIVFKDSLIVAVKPKPPVKYNGDVLDEDDDEEDLKFQLPRLTSGWKRMLFSFLHDKLSLPDMLLMAIFSVSLKGWAIIVMWFILAPVAHRWDLGPLYILATGFAIIFFNLGKRQQGDMSAYSIFNEDFRELPGTLNADRLDRDIRAGQF